MIPGLYFEEILIHKLLARPSDFRAVFRASPDAMLLVGADGLLRDANPEAETMFGWSREELVGESVEIPGSRRASGPPPPPPGSVPPQTHIAPDGRRHGT